MAYLDKLLGEGEGPVFRTHQHWVAFAGRNWPFIVLLLLTVVLAGAFQWFADPLFANFKVTDQQTQWIVRGAVALVLVVYPLFRFLLAFYRWRAEEYVITNYRVIQLSGIFEKNVIDSSLEKVNDVMMHQSLIGRWLNYGNVEILTASEVAINNFSRVAQPVQFKTAMLNAKQALERGTPSVIGGPAAATAASIPDLIARYASLRDQGAITEDEFQAKKQELLAQQ